MIRLKFGQTMQDSDEPGYVNISGTCQVLGTEYRINHVSILGLEAWCDGELIQRALPHMHKDDREFLISGTSPAGWEKLFPPGWDDDE